MANDTYRTRKEQIEDDFLRNLLRNLKSAGCPITRKGRNLIKEELKAAAMVGACEERSRALQLIKERGTFAAEEIVQKSVLDVLGYE